MEKAFDNEIFDLTPAQRKAWHNLMSEIEVCDACGLSFILADYGTILVPFNSNGIKVHYSGFPLSVEDIDKESKTEIDGSKFDWKSHYHVGIDPWPLSETDTLEIYEKIKRDEKDGKNECNRQDNGAAQ